MIDGKQLDSLDATIEEVYLGHMGKDLSFIPINPIELLQSASGTVGLDPIKDTAPAIRESFDKHIKRLDGLGIDIRPALAASYFVNMLTEANLPHYTETIGKVAGDEGALRTWLNEWTAEEHPHEVVMRDYALMSGIMGNDESTIPNQEYAKGTVSQHRHGTEISITSLAQGFAYLTLQEDATYLAHMQEGAILDSVGDHVHRKIAGNEFKHHRVYGKLAGKMLELYPDETVVGIRDVYKNFEMPGQIGIPDFRRHSFTIAMAGIFGPQSILDMQERHIAKVYRMEDVQVTSDDAKRAQAELIEGMEEWKKAASKIDERQDKKVEKAKKAGKPTPFILGKTVKLDDKQLVPV